MSCWLLRYDGFDPAQEGLREALCTLGNGYAATRGAAPEARADGVHYPGVYVAGCYNRLTTAEVAGRAVENEDLVNVPNWLPLTFRAEDGEWFGVEQAELLSYWQELDMRRGVLTRLVRLRDMAGRITLVTQRRLVSMDDPHLTALEITILPENWTGRLGVRSALDGTVTNAGVARYRTLNGRHLVPVATGCDGEDVVWLQVRTATSRVEIAQAARTRVSGGTGRAGRRPRREDGWVAHELTLDVVEGRPVAVEKVAALFTSRDRAIAESVLAARRRVERAGDFDALLERHVLAWDRLWRHCHIDMGGGEPQRALNLHMFHLLQTLSPHVADLDVGVPARGLHGEAYRGHVFWDEVFVFPFLTLHCPAIARALLMYRWRRLPEARWAAREAGYPGAMYPWQSGSDGREETQRLHLNPRSGRWLPDYSHLQRHVGLAIAYNVWNYYRATGDADFLSEFGAQMLLEIARFFAGLTTYNRALDRYEIRGVMGPDEYHDGYPDTETLGVDNNAYTNIMAVWVWRRALDTLALLPEHRRRELGEHLALEGAETDLFEDLTRRMRVVFHGEGIISQFERYAELAELDWAGYRRRYGDVRRLDRILEAEGDTPNRYKASKQADVLMLFYLLPSEELEDILTRLGYPYGPGTIPDNIEYYLGRTAHGSTLSAVVHAWVLARSDRLASWRFFLEALDSDIKDIQGGTTAEGIHLGAMAGSVDLVQRCYTGIEPRAEALRLNPLLPRSLDTLTLELRYRGCWGVQMRCDHDRVRIGVRQDVAVPIEVEVEGRTATIEPGGAWEVPR